MAGISDKALKSHYTENTCRNNKGSELQSKEFADGYGLEMYRAHLRELGPQLGRWQVDSKADGGQESFSPFASMFNDPVLKNDPLGDKPEDEIRIRRKGVGVGAKFGGMATFSNAKLIDNWSIPY